MLIDIHVNGMFRNVQKSKLDKASHFMNLAGLTLTFTLLKWG